MQVSSYRNAVMCTAVDVMPYVVNAVVIEDVVVTCGNLSYNAVIRTCGNEEEIRIICKYHLACIHKVCINTGSRANSSDVAEEFS